MVSTTFVGIVTGICGTLLVAYCIYFDQVRRSDPDFKQKLRERRKAAKNAKRKPRYPTKFPNPRDPEAAQKFFLTEIHMGEDSLAVGDIEEGAMHLSNAISVCREPQQLLMVLQRQLPPQVYGLIMDYLHQSELH